MLGHIVAAVELATCWIPMGTHAVVMTDVFTHFAGNNKITFFFFLDANECLQGSHVCVQTCHNTVGSYSCGCNSGYRLNLDGRSCNGIYKV